MIYVDAPMSYQFVKWDGTNEAAVVTALIDYLNEVSPGSGNSITYSVSSTLDISGSPLSPGTVHLDSGSSITFKYRKGIPQPIGSLGAVTDQQIADRYVPVAP